MQKIFKRNAIIIVTLAVVIIEIINGIFLGYSLKRQQFRMFDVKIEQIIHTLENNRGELENIKESLDEDYLTRAKAAAYVFERNEDVLHSVGELQNLAKLLNVDEIHVIDENGIIIYSSVTRYIGLDFEEGEQTREFLSILESDDPEAYLIQEAQPNAAEGRMMKYVGVARKGKKGIVQVGLEPTRQLEAQERNTYEYIFSRFPMNSGEEFFAIDTKSGQMLAHTDRTSIQAMQAYDEAFFEGCEDGAFRRDVTGKYKYFVVRRYGDVLIGAAVPAGVLMADLWKNLLLIAFCLFLIEAIVLILLNYLVRTRVTDGIHGILAELNHISAGNLDTKVSVGGNPEFEQLSAGINGMVKSIVKASDRLAKIIAMSEMPLVAFEHPAGRKTVFMTAGFKEMLGLSQEEIDRVHDAPEEFLAMIEKLTETPLRGETDIFQVGSEKYVRIHLSKEADGYLGVVTDATAQVQQKQRMEYENNHDQLTGLCRYHYFKQQAAELSGRLLPGRLWGIVMLDLDFFKGINDTYGHDAGDQYLQGMAERMKSLPKEHCVAARRSGDEFCLLLYDYASREEMIAVLERFWNEFSQFPVAVSDTEKRVISVSGGFAWTAERNMDAETLLRQADEALYRMKSGAKGYFIEYQDDVK